MRIDFGFTETAKRRTEKSQISAKVISDTDIACGLLS